MTYCVVRTVYYGPDRTMYQGRILVGASFDEAWDCVTRWCDWDLRFLNGRHGDGAYTEMLLWPSQKHCRHITRIAPSLKYCGSFSESQPREIVYEIWEEAEPDKNHKEENTMTNAELNKKIEDLAEKVDRYYDNQESLFRIRDEETEKLKKELNDILGRYSNEYDERFDADNDRIKYLNDKLGRIEHRLDSMYDAGTYVRQVAEESKKIEDALKVTTRKLYLFSQKNAELMERNKRLSEQNVQLQEDVKASNKMCDSVSKKASKLADRVQKLETAQKQLRLDIISTYGVHTEAKTIESMYPCLWNCEHKGKECNGQAQECPIAEHFSKQLQHPYSYCEKDVAVTQECLEKFMENKRDIIFSEFNAGKRAIVFSDSDYLEKDFLDFWREYTKWEDKKLHSRYIDFYDYIRPFLKQPAIYDKREPFAIWLDPKNEEYSDYFQYGTLQSTWRKHNVIGGLPYTEWSV